MISRASWHRRVGAIVLFWIVAAGLVSLFHRNLPSSHWLLVHLLLLGAATNAILIWSDHFATSLLRLPDTPVRVRVARLIMLNVGVVAIVVGVIGEASVAVIVGAMFAIAAISWHVIMMLVRMRDALASRFFVSVHYYVASGILFAGVVALGVILSRGYVAVDHAQLVLAHAVGALLGWIGLSILGTLITFWPTILRTKIDDQAQRAASRALAPLIVGSVATGFGFLVGLQLVVIVGLVVYLVGVGLLGGPFVRVMTSRAPAEFAPLSVLASVIWMGLGVLGLILVVALSGGNWELVAERSGTLSAVVVAGCVAQVLLGSLSFLLPTMVGGGPAAMRWRSQVVNSSAVTRVVATNGALILCALPTASTVRVVASVVALVPLAWTVPLLIRAMGTPPESVRAEAATSSQGERADVRLRPARLGGQVVAGVSVLVLAVALAAAVDPAAIGLGAGSTASAAAGVAVTGQTTEVSVEMKGMRFLPDRIEVPAGNNLVIKLTNNGDDVHDLTLETGQDSGRIKPGESTNFEVGVVGRDLDGWCSIAGHRQMGMVLQIVATGANANPDLAAGGTSAHSAHAHGDHTAASETGSNESGDIDSQAIANLMNDPGPDFKARNAVLAPATNQKVHRVELKVTEVEQEVAPGIRQQRWTFGGQAPGPTLRGKVGDKFVVTLVNDGTIGHSIDFHAGALAPDKPMRTIAPGESLTYSFTAKKAGIWMYHCSTMPMSVHIANGMFGAVVIDPPDLPKVDKEFVLVQSELYLGPQGQSADAAKVLSDQPSLVTFNGYAMQYDFRPLQVRAGDRVRFWVLDAGPNRPSSFHVVGGQFDRVWFEGSYLLKGGPGGSQAMALQPAQGGFVELRIPEAGNYPFVTHIMSDAEKGAHGILQAR